MMTESNIASFDYLIEQFHRLPGIGSKTALRLAYHMISIPQEEALKLADAIAQARQKLHYCRICCNLTDKELCYICTDDKRNAEVICVVEDISDVMALERTGKFNGRYHVLHGVLSPMKGVLPDMLRIKELLARLQDKTVKEIILATNATVEGEATAMYLSKLIKPLGVRVTRLAYGVPVGGDLEYTDEVTLSFAIEGRREL